MAYCRMCGAELSDGAAFCMKCGCPTGTNDEKTQPQAPATTSSVTQSTPVYQPSKNDTVYAESSASKQKKKGKFGKIVLGAVLCGFLFSCISNLGNSGRSTLNSSPATSSTQAESANNRPETTSSDSNSSDTSNAEPAPEPEPDDGINWMTSGTYAVGTDIEPGEYFCVATSGSLYFEVNKDTSGSFDSIVSNESTSTFAYVTLLEGQFFEIHGGEFIPVAVKEENGLVPTELGEGMYKVGVDIAPGEYLIESDYGSAYFEVDSNSFNIFDSIVSNENVSSRHYITVEEGQYLKLDEGRFTPVDSIEPYSLKGDAYGDGMYKVGFDIPAGSYVVTSNDSYCYIEVDSNSYNTFDSIIRNDGISLGESTTVSVSEGEYLYVSGGTFVAA